MNCWHCKTELIWGGDEDLDDDESEEFSMVTNLSCSGCGSLVEVYFPKKATRRVIAALIGSGFK